MSYLSTAFDAFLSIPGLRGFWPLNSFDESGNALDLSGHAQTLTLNGTPTYGISTLGTGYIEFGSPGYLSHADATHYDILGTESYVGSVKGLTLGGWFYFPSFSGVHQGMNKSNFISNCSYELTNVSSGSAAFRFGVSGDGTSGARKFATMAGTLTTGAWHFLVGRFTPGTEVAIFTDTTKAVNTTSIPASIFNSTREFRIDDGSGSRAAMCFLSAEAISDALLDQLYEDTWPLFNPITGTLAKTLGTLTLSSAGTVAVAGALAKTLGALTSTGAGTVATAGTLTKTLGALTSTSAGTVAITGSLAKTLGALTLVSVGAGEGIQGSLNQTLGGLTLISTGTVEIAGTLARTLGPLTSTGAGAVVEYRTYIISDSLAFDDSGDSGAAVIAPIFVSTDTLTFTEVIAAPLIIQTDTLTFTDTPVITVAPIVITDTLTFFEGIDVTGAPVTPPTAAATGGLDSNHVLRLLYGNDKRNPTRTLDIAQSAGGHIFLLKGSGFAPGAGELNELWSGESIRHHGQKKLAESRKNSVIGINYNLTSGSMAGLSALQREISRFFLEVKLQQVGRQGEKVWLEYRWADNLNSLPTPTFGQLSSYYEVYADTPPKWPDDLHDGDLVAGEIGGVTVELICSPAPKGLKQRAATAAGAISLHTHGVLIASGSSSKLHWPGYMGSGLTGQNYLTGLTGNFTITGWITHNATWSSGTKDIFDYFADASNRIRIQYDRGNTRWVITKIVSGTTFTANSGSDSIVSGDHNHLILVQDDTTLHLYVNGVEVASVTATNTMTDYGLIAIGCPAAGTIDGVDVILDGWRILPDDITSTQALAIYTAELPIKQNSNRVGEPPYFLTTAGMGQVGSCDDTTHEHWGIIGGVGGDIEAETDIRLTMADAASKHYWLGIKAQDETFTPEDYLWSEVSTGGSSQADVTASEGSYHRYIGTALTALGSHTSLDPAIVLGKYHWLVRARSSGTATVTPGWFFTNNIPVVNRAVSVTNTAFEVLSFGDTFIETEGDAMIRDSANISLAMRVGIAAAVSVNFDIDFSFLLPKPFAKISQPDNASAATPTSSISLVIEDGHAYIYTAGGRQSDKYEYQGDRLEVAPNKYNYLFLMRLNSSNDFLRTNVTDVAVFVTPRYLLPGGMVA